MFAGLDEADADPAEEYESAGDGEQSAGEREGEMWAVYGEEGYLSLICTPPSAGAVGGALSLTDSDEDEDEDGDERAGPSWPELICCSDEERDGGFGGVERGER